MRYVCCFIFLYLPIAIGGLCSCSSAFIKHIPAQQVSKALTDSVNRQLARSRVTVFTKDREYDRKRGLVSLQNDTLLLRSSVLFDTLRISLDSVRQFNCYENLPVSTIAIATVGGALTGYVASQTGSKDPNSELPVGLSVIGAIIGGFSAYIADRETIYLIETPVQREKRELREQQVQKEQREQQNRLRKGKKAEPQEPLGPEPIAPEAPKEP